MKRLINRIQNIAKINATVNRNLMPFIVISSIIIILVGLGISAGIFYRDRELMNSAILDRARALFTNIIITRQWNTDYGGVYVKKRPGEKPYPYLKNSEIYTRDGKVYTQKNHALMVREISRYAEEDGTFEFHLTSLNPINPINKPDKFEEKALVSFDKGETEYSRMVNINNKYIFRYMAPVYMENNCMPCHKQQDYKIGDVRGGISITFDNTEITEEFTENKYILITLFILTVIILLGVLAVLSFILMRKLSGAYEKISSMAITDELTQLYNRRHFFPKLEEEFETAKRYSHPLSCILIDIDNFKSINDTYGHQAGDIVLRTISDTIKSNCRKTDTVARFGGEEIIILLSETDCDNALKLAEKLRMSIKEINFDFNNQKVNITISLGVAGFTIEEISEVQDIKSIIKFADEAMYTAKNKGKDRVEIYRDMVK